MWLKVIPDIELTMNVDLPGVNENTRDYDVQLYENNVRDALMEKLKIIFDESDVKIYSVDVGVAREKYVKFKAA